MVLKKKFKSLCLNSVDPFCLIFNIFNSKTVQRLLLFSLHELFLEAIYRCIIKRRSIFCGNKHTVSLSTMFVWFLLVYFAKKQESSIYSKQCRRALWQGILQWEICMCSEINTILSKNDAEGQEKSFNSFRKCAVELNVRLFTT